VVVAAGEVVLAVLEEEGGERAVVVDVVVSKLRERCSKRGAARFSQTKAEDLGIIMRSRLPRIRNVWRRLSSAGDE